MRLQLKPFLVFLFLIVLAEKDILGNGGLSIDT